MFTGSSYDQSIIRMIFCLKASVLCASSGFDSHEISDVILQWLLKAVFLQAQSAIFNINLDEDMV